VTVVRFLRHWLLIVRMRAAIAGAHRRSDVCEFTLTHNSAEWWSEALFRFVVIVVREDRTPAGAILCLLRNLDRRYTLASMLLMSPPGASRHCYVIEATL
jgi:hypothetical protein